MFEISDRMKWRQTRLSNVTLHSTTNSTNIALQSSVRDSLIENCPLCKFRLWCGLLIQLILPKLIDETFIG